MTPDALRRAIIAATRAAVDGGELDISVPTAVPLRYTGRTWSTPLPLRLAGVAGRPAPEVAAVLARNLSQAPGVAFAEATGAGFLTLTPADPGAILAGVAAGDLTISGEYKSPWPQRPLTFANPGFAVRFAHARAASALCHAEALGVPVSYHEPGQRTDFELTLVSLLADLSTRDTQNGDVLAGQLERIAAAYHDVHEHCPALPKGDEPVTESHGARLLLAGATRVVLRDGLRAFGETAPDRM